MMKSIHSGNEAGRIGSYSMAFGILACMCVFVPVIGDLIAAPLAILAVACGLKITWNAGTEKSLQAAHAVVGVIAGAVVLTWIGIGVMIP